MSDLAAVAFALIAVCITIYVVVSIYNRRVNARVASRIARIPWTFEEHADAANSDMVLSVLRPGTTEVAWRKRISCDDPDYDNKLEEARVEATIKIQTLNRGLPR